MKIAVWLNKCEWPDKCLWRKINLRQTCSIICDRSFLAAREMWGRCGRFTAVVRWEHDKLAIQFDFRINRSYERTLYLLSFRKERWMRLGIASYLHREQFDEYFNLTEWFPCREWRFIAQSKRQTSERATNREDESQKKSGRSKPLSSTVVTMGAMP